MSSHKIPAFSLQVAGRYIRKARNMKNLSEIIQQNMLELKMDMLSYQHFLTVLEFGQSYNAHL